MESKNFKIVGLKSNGEYVIFSKEVPMLAQELLSRANEILSATNTEIALFEPKRGKEHQRGHYYVGLIVKAKPNVVPAGMEYMELNQRYITTRGNISKLEELHLNLVDWAEGKGYRRDLDSYIVETYHPVEEGEEVQIYLPINTISL